MATTLTAVLCRGSLIIGAHCGDSRAYILRGKGLKQLTNDHTEVARLVSEGLLAKEDVANYPRRNVITSALGTHKNLVVQSFTFDSLPGDRLLLLTDGVYSLVTKRELQKLSSQETSLRFYCEKAIEIVKSRPASDNFTLVAIEF